ncbi:trace amine-associated receptor 4-like [Lytechinus pictus]|uniref:trace amine-associated receptor 4-like n=1 Tax=Lytechinus pictus TaxID=7653 RepID=UPI00240DBE4F|nr:trace amine-associated receptor 4-like [Lytechinus pictus]
MYLHFSHDFNVTQVSDVVLFSYIQAAISGALSIVTIFFNSFALAILHRWHQEFEDVSRIQFKSLAVTNLIGGVLLGTFECIYNSRSSFSTTACIYIPFAYSFLWLSSTYHVALINLQRYVAVCYPLHYIRLATVKRLGLIFIAMESVFFAISFMFYPGPGFPLTKLMTSFCIHHSVDYIEEEDATLGQSAFIAFSVYVALCIIPFVMLTCMNIRLLVIATRASRQQHVVSAGGSDGDRESTSARSRAPGRKGLRTVLIITGLFYITIIPLFVTFVAMVSVSLSDQSYEVLFFVSNVIMLCSCWWNVPVYMSTSSLVNRRARELWKQSKCCTLRRNRISYGDDLTLYNCSETGLS